MQQAAGLMSFCASIFRLFNGVSRSHSIKVRVTAISKIHGVSRTFQVAARKRINSDLAGVVSLVCRDIDVRARTRTGVRIGRQHYCWRQNKSPTEQLSRHVLCARTDLGREHELVKMHGVRCIRMSFRLFYGGKGDKQLILPTVTPALKVAVELEEEERCLFYTKRERKFRSGPRPPACLEDRLDSGI